MSAAKPVVDKNAKKLKNFFDKNASLAKRWKSLTAYVEKATPEDLSKFYNENFYMIYGVFLDTFQAYENSVKKGKHSNSEMIDLTIILRNVLVHLSELIRKKWQTRSIASVLEKVLYKENKINLRLIGFELLLIFLEAVQTLEPSQVDLFAMAIDLGPFCIDRNANAKLRYTGLCAPDKQSILLPSGAPSTIETSVKLWEFMLDYVTNYPNTFEFWFDLLKKQYLADFYPEISLKLGLIEDGSFGFQVCPYQIQAVIISRLDQWMKIDSLVKYLWSSEQNVQILLEVFRQVCRLPISYASSIKLGINLFKQLFFGPKIFPEIEGKIVEFRQFFFQQVVSTFNVGSEEHISLCLETVGMFKQIFLEIYDSFAVETKECMLHTLLNATTEMCKNNQVPDRVASTTLDTIFFIWIHTKMNTPAMWASLQQGVASLFHFMEPIKQTKLKLIQLTLVIKNMIYPQRKQKKKPAREPSEGEQPPKKETPKSICPDTRPPLPEIPIDPNIADINWTVDEVLYVWTQVLNVLKNLNSIKDPHIHAEAMGVLSDLIIILQNAEEGVPHAHTLDESAPKPLCLINIFGPWLFEACSLPETHIVGKSTAVGTLCQLIVRHSGETLPLDLLSHFYAIIFQCLRDHPNSIVSWSILVNSSNIFNMALPGCNTLIPHYIAEIKRVLRGQGGNEDVRTKSILIIGSLICYPNHLESIGAPMDIFQKSAEYNFQTQLKKDVSQILIETLNQDPNAEHKVMCIWTMCCLVFEELLHKPNLSLVKEITKTIIPFLTFQENIVSRAALDCFSTISLLFEELRQLDESAINIIIDVLSSNILRLLLEAKLQPKLSPLNPNLVSDHFFCLLDWIMASTVYIFDKRALASKVFEAIEIGLLGQKLQVDSNQNQSIVDKKDKKKDPKRMSVREGGISSMGMPLNDLLEQLRKQPSHGSEAIKEAAQILLVQLCNFLQNFPYKEGIEIMSSQVSEDDDIEEHKPLFFIYNDFALFSLVEVPMEDGSYLSRLILRDCTGKYAWDSRINYNNYTYTVAPPFSLLAKPIAPVLQPIPIVYSQSDRQSGVAPKATHNDGPPVDQLDDLLQYLGESFKDCLPESGSPLNQPTPPPADYAEFIDVTQSSLLKQNEADITMIENIQANLPSYQSWAYEPPEIPSPLSALHHCRLFLNHLGFLSFDKQHLFSMVEDSQRFNRSIQQLDKTSGREMLKIGVIYVKYGQDDQKVLLRNDTKSELYAEFVRGLGWPIDIATHKGYLGGLDPKLTTGVTAPYYANSVMEVVFHDISSMPTIPSDNQQIHKKRHVGNDIVHIVYSEHSGDYLPTTITSQFNDAHIIVYPLPNGLYRIQIYRKENVQLFGPLLHGMCVNKKLLPILVRHTAINANRYVRYNTGGYSRAFPTRRRALDEIVQKFKVKRPYEDLIGELITPKPSPNQPPAEKTPKQKD